MAENIFSITITKAALISPNERKKVADMIRPFITEQRYQGATLTHTISHWLQATESQNSDHRKHKLKFPVN